ncbi:hypothetical protein KCV01_g18756, partial [Aureobasidium melanogenum]
MEEQLPLSFKELNRRIEEFPVHDQAKAKAPLRAKISLAIVGLTSFLLWASQYFGHDPIVVYVDAVLLIADFCALVVHIWSTRFEILSWTPLRDLADQLDHDRKPHHAIIDWLVSQSNAELIQFADLTRFRKERMAQKFPVLIGGFQPLGILALASALYFLAREWTNGHRFGFLEMAAGYILFLAYLLAWIAASTKMRMDAMDMYLQEAVRIQNERLEAEPEDSLPKFGHSPQTPDAPLR